MRIDVIISAADVKLEKIKGKVVVIIDTLRATSVMVTSLMNGCEKIIPVREVEEAKSIAEAFRGSCLLGGERGGLKISGFDLSNSPFDYKREVVEGKTIVMTTTNGTQAINNCIEGDTILVGCFLNGQALAEKLLEMEQDVVIVNAGTNGEFSKDDFITAGYIISSLVYKSSVDVELSDIAITAMDIYRDHPDIISYVEDAYHYQKLKSLGYEEDIKYCFTKDITSIVPEIRDGYVK